MRFTWEGVLEKFTSECIASVPSLCYDHGHIFQTATTMEASTGTEVNDYHPELAV